MIFAYFYEFLKSFLKKSKVLISEQIFLPLLSLIYEVYEEGIQEKKNFKRQKKSEIVLMVKHCVESICITFMQMRSRFTN